MRRTIGGRPPYGPRHVLWLGIAVAGVLLPRPGLATIRHVPAGYATIRAAANAAANGDTVLIAPGTYTGGVFIRDKALTYASNYLLTGDTTTISQTVVNGVANGTCSGAPGCNGNSVFEFGPNAHGSSIVGLTVSGGENGVGSSSIVNVSHCRIIGNGDGIDYVTDSGGTLSNSVFEANTDDGIDLNGRMNLTIRDNLIRNNGDDGIEFRLLLFTGPAVTVDILGNTITGNGEDGIQLIDYPSLANYVVRIDHNRFSGNFDATGLSAAIGVMGNGETIENLSGSPMPERVIVSNNTITGEKNGIVGGANLIALNNVFSGIAGKALRRVSGNSIASYSLFWNNAVNVETSVVDSAHILVADPLLGPAGDLTAGSPAIDAGTASFQWMGETVLSLPSSQYAGSAPDLGAIEFGSGPPPQNFPPIVGAGPDQTVQYPAPASLAGTVSDDGHPDPPAGVTTHWSVLSAAGPMVIQDPDLQATTASFSRAGVYRLRLTATDGALMTADTVQIMVVTGANAAPVVDAGPNQTLTLPASAALDGTVSDDGLPNPPGAMTTTWTKGSGPGTVTFANANAVDTQASFSMAGTYILRLTANDSALSRTDSVQVTVLPAPNQAPVVDAGPNRTIMLPASASLDGTVSDDGLPNPPGAVTPTWTKGSGPGTVTFANANAVDTQASFSIAGTYILRLTASDGALAGADSVTVTVLAPVPPIDQRIAAASDDTEEDGSGNITTNTSDIELVFSVSNQTVGLRFTNITLAPGTTINKAYIQFEADEVQSEVTNLTLQGQAADNAATFTTAKFDVSSRPRTTASVAWSPVPWNVVGEQGVNQQTTDLKSVIQEIVNRPGWASGNALAIVITGTGHRTARSFEGVPAGAALLHIEAGPPPPTNVAPVVDAGPNRSIVLPNDAVLDGTVTDDDLPNPPGTVTTTWTVGSGPGPVSFGDPSQVDTPVTFTVAGTYILRLTANDGALGATDSMQFVVQSPPNSPPVVDAGPNRTITLPASAALDGTVSDDGLPSPPAAVTTTWTKGSGPGTVTFANANAVDTQASFSVAGTYILRLTANDGAASTTDSMTVTALPPANAAPTVDAGPNQTITLPASAALDGTVTDDGQPSPPGVVTTTWTKGSGPGTVTFANANAVDTQASFSIAGTYILRLTANDSALSRTDSVTITVLPVPNAAPVVDAGPNQTITLPAGASLDGTVSDDGLPSPPATVTTSWTKGSGPGTVTFANANAIDTQASFSIAGTYILRLTANDSALSRTDSVTITVLPVPNAAPVVDAGPTAVITLPASASLDGTVSDDGLPNPPAVVTTTWTKGSGPGTVTFVDANAIDTQASFSAAGTYVLRLTASDGALSMADSVQVIAQAAPPAVDRRIATGTDDAEEPTGASTSLYSTDIEMVYETAAQTVGLRFTNVTVPKGAAITKAYIQFEADEAQSEVTNLTFNGQAADNAPTFTTAAGNITSRARTTASAAWSPVPWSVIGEQGANQRTPELKTVIQEIVNRPGWASGNAMVIVVSGTGHRTARSYDGLAASAALLHIETGAAPPPNTAPTVDAGPNQTVSMPASASLDGTVSDDGLPSPPGVTTTTWTKGSGPGTVTFANANAVDTQASFSAGGTYILRLTANDGAASVTDSVQVTVMSGPNAAPVVDAGPNRSVTMPASASLDGTVTDDGLPSPPGVVTVTWTKGSGPGTVTFQNANAVDTQASFSVAGTYILRLTASDSALGTTDSMTVTVSPAPNAAPVVDAGPNRSVTMPASALLDGTVTDDGLPSPPGAVTTTWTKGSGPGTVTFQNANAIDTQASFSIAGTYVLRLTANDGALSATDSMTVTVSPVQNTAPVVDAGQNHGITLPASAPLDGTVTDDGLPNPPGAVTTTWSKGSGPGTVTFVNANAVVTQASFSVAGTYVLRLTANDSVLSATDSVTITVSPVPNQAPVVDAGSNQTINFTASAALDGTVTDDGLPNPPGAVTTTWTKGSGPGTVTFANANAVDTQASFSMIGTYVLRLIASDSALSTTDSVTITVLNTAPMVDAGANQTITMPSNAALDGTVTDDGQPNPPGALTTTWSKGSGPGTVTFANANAVDTQASFSVAGTYVLRLNASDSALSATDSVAITVQPDPNVAPVVNAGVDQTIVLPASAALDATVTDDGLPAPPALSPTWSVVSGPGPVTFANANAVDTQASFTTAGIYVLQLAVSDGRLTTTDQVQITVQAVAAPSEKRVVASSDDAEESSSGVMNLTSTNLELVTNGTDQVVGLRFTALSIPAGATITKAYVQFTARRVDHGTTSLVVRGQAADNAPTFTGSSTNLSSRPRTTAAVNWSPPDWTKIGDAIAEERTPEIKDVIQEIVARPGWASGNALVIVITGTGTRTASPYDGAAAEAPLLHVEYATAGAPLMAMRAVAPMAHPAAESPPLEFALHGVGESPVRGGLWVEFTLAEEGAATLELMDVAGRRVATIDAGAFGIGRHQVAVREKLPAGVYLVRLAQGPRRRVMKVAVLK